MGPKACLNIILRLFQHVCNTVGKQKHTGSASRHACSPLRNSDTEIYKVLCEPTVLAANMCRT